MNETVDRLCLRFGENVTRVRGSSDRLDFGTGTRSLNELSKVIIPNTIIVTQTVNRMVLELINQAYRNNATAWCNDVYFLCTVGTDILFTDKIIARNKTYSITNIEKQFGLLVMGKTCTQD